MSSRLSRSRTSVHCLHQGSYDVSSDKIVYIHEPQIDYIDYHDSRILRKHRLKRRRRSCVNRFCVGVCNFFTRAKTKESHHEQHHNYAPPPAICYVPSRTTRPPGTRLCADSALAQGSHFEYDLDYSKDFGSGIERDFIIYVPRQSTRYKNGKHYYADGANCEPLIIRTCPSGRCADCSSRINSVSASIISYHNYG